jgi:DNA-binding MarR family transcriptional regulator
VEFSENINLGYKIICKMEKLKEKIENVAQLICELTRNCTIKEEFFARSFNLSPTEVRFLKLFVHRNLLTVNEIQNLLKLTTGRISHILKSLESKNLITRIKTPKDKRNIEIKLQPKAMLFVNNLHNNYNDLNDSILNQVGKEELDQITDSLNTLLNLFTKWVGQNSSEITQEN